MFFLHFKNELLNNILSHKFYIGFILIFLVFPISLFIKNIEYNKKFEIYQVSIQNWLNTPENPIHTDIKVSLYRPISPLSIFSRETGEYLGNKFSTSGIGGSFEISSYTQTNTFFNKLKKNDPLLIVSFLISLFALLLTYDSISGERESGTLELKFSYSISRHNILFGKYLTSLILILFPFTLSFFVSILLLLSQKNFFLDFDAWLRLSLLLFSTFLIISLFCWIGLFLSILNKKSSTVLMSCLFLWFFLGIIYPNLSQWMGKIFSPIKDSPGKKVYVFNPNDPRKIRQLEVSNKRTLAFINQVIQQYSLSKIFSYASPLDLFQHSCSSLMEEDPDAYNHFLRQSLNYNEQFISWQKKMIKKYPVTRMIRGGEELDLSELPHFDFKRERLINSLPKFITDVSVLIFYNFFFSLSAYLMFLKYDPRSLKT